MFIIYYFSNNENVALVHWTRHFYVRRVKGRKLPDFSLDKKQKAREGRLCLSGILLHIPRRFLSAGFYIFSDYLRILLFFLCKLRVVQIRVSAVLRQQLIMRALFHDIAVIHNQNHVGIFNRR